MLIHGKFYCEGNDIYYKFHNITERLTKRQNVEFALYCAKDVFHLVEDQDKERAKCCINLVEKWLIDEKSVTNEELSNAADAAWTAAYAAARAGWTAARAADYAAAYASWAADYAAAYASWAADCAAGTAANANAYDVAWAATHATRAYAESNKLNEYLVVANSHLTKTNVNCLNYEIEGKILYLIDELDENIIVHKDKYYVNMNGIEKCPEYGFNTQQELLNELFNSKCLFWGFVRNWLDNLYKEETQC